MTQHSRSQMGLYRLRKSIGQGSHAEVFLGEHVYLYTEAAVKVWHAPLAQDQIRQSFVEARTLAHLVHPNIVRVLDFDIENTIPFLVMDYAPNGTMRKYYSPGICLPPTTVVSHVNELASALQFAHDARVIHRDVKPENMLLGRYGEILLSDFGIAVTVSRPGTRRAHKAAGTALYVAPENIKKNPQEASDQYSLAAVAFEWLTGSPPFTAPTTPAILVQHLYDPVPSLRAWVPTIPPAVEWVIQKALSKDPQDRFASVWEFAVALEEACYRRWWMRLGWDRFQALMRRT